MGKKVFAICKQQNWDIADVGLRATGRDIGGDSRTWSQADLTKVLDTMKEGLGCGMTWDIGELLGVLLCAYLRVSGCAELNRRRRRARRYLRRVR